MPSEQLGLRYDGSSFADAAWRALLDVVREVVAEMSLKEVSYRLDVSATQLAHALAERDRHYVRGEWLLAIAAMDRSGRVARVVADAAGYDLVHKKPPTPDEELAGIKRAMERCLSPEMRAVLLNEAKRSL